MYIFEEISIHFYLYVFIHTNSCEGFGRLLFSIFSLPFYGRFAQYVNNNIYAHGFFFFIVQYKYILYKKGDREGKKKVSGGI